jgi:hypothetical protein
MMMMMITIRCTGFTRSSAYRVNQNQNLVCFRPLTEYKTLHYSHLTVRTAALLMFLSTKVYPEVSGLATWSENCKWYSGHEVKLYRYFMCQSSEFCRHNPLCCFSTSVCCCLFRYDSVRKLLDIYSYSCECRVVSICMSCFYWKSWY